MSPARPILTIVAPFCFAASLTAQPDWDDLSVPNDPALFVVDFVDPDSGWVTGRGTVAFSSDGGQTWENRAPTPSTAYTAILALSPDSVWVQDSNSRLWYTFDGGDNWAFHQWDSGGPENIKVNSQGVFLAVGGAPPPIQGPIWRSTNGTDWQQINPGTDRRFLDDVAFGDDSTAWVVGTDGVIMKTTDLGDTWSHQESGIGDVNAVYFFDSDTGWAVGDSGDVIFTTDGGENWQFKESGVDVNLFNVLFTTRNRGWISGFDGTLLYTVDGGETWVKLETGTSLRLTGISFPDPDHGWIVGNTQFMETGGLMRRTTHGTSVATQVEIPHGTGAVQTYPNPSDGSPILSFELDVPSEVRIEVFNELGQLFWTTESSPRAAGVHRVSLADGNLTPGVYFYRVFTASEVKPGRMVIAR